MTWFRLDDGSHDHPKIEAAGNATWGLVCRLGAWSAQKLTDGFVPDAIVRRYSTPAERKRATTVGLLIPGDHANPPDPRATPGNYGPGVWLHDFLDRNPTRTQVEADRAAAAARQKRGRDKQGESRRESRRDIGRTDTVSHGGPDPTRPDPTHVSNPPPQLQASSDHPAGAEGDAGGRFDQQYAAALDLAVTRELATTDPPPRNPQAWAKAVRTRIDRDHGPAISRAIKAGATPAQALDPPRIDPAEAGARSMVNGLHLTGEPPDEIWHTVASSHPRHADAIADELQHLTGWTPPNATITPIRGATK